MDSEPNQDKNLRISGIEVRPSRKDWRSEAYDEWREKGRWSRMLGGGFVSSSKDPYDWEHPYLK